MLVLSRKLNEEVVIPDLNITVRIVGMTSGRVQLGIDAPREIQISRPEICRVGLSISAAGEVSAGSGVS